VSSSLEGGIRVMLENFDVSSSSSVNEPRSPDLIWDFVQFGQASMSDSKRNSGDINVTRVNQDLEFGSFGEEILVIGDHRVSKAGVVEGSSSALVPRHVLGSDGTLDVLSVQVVDHSVSDGVASVGISKVGGEFESSVSSAEILVKIIGIETGFLNEFLEDVLLHFDVSLLLEDNSDLVDRGG